MKSKQVVLVRWEDTTHSEGPLRPEHCGGTFLLDTVGFLVRKDKKEIVVASEDCDSDNRYRHVFAIPLRCVDKIVKLHRK